MDTSPAELIDDQPKNSETSPVPEPDDQSPKLNPRSKSRTIIRMLTTKLSTPRQPKPPPTVVNAYSKEQRDAALRERGLLPPLPMSQQEAIQDKAIPIVSTGHTRDTSQGPSAADLIKKEWENKNKKPSDDERDRMNGFKFGATTTTATTTTTTVTTEDISPITQHRRGGSSDIGHGSFSRAYNQPLPPSPSPHPPSSFSRSTSPISNPKRRNTTAATSSSSSSSSSPAASRSPSPPPKSQLHPLPSPPTSIPSRLLPETPPKDSQQPSSESPALSSTTHVPLPVIPISPVNPSPNGDNPPLISLTPPNAPLPPTPPTRRSTVATPLASRPPSRPASRPTSPLPQPPTQQPNNVSGTPSRSRAGSSSTSSPTRRINTTLEHKRNEESFSSLMEKSMEAVFAGISRPRSGSKSASRSASPTPVPTPRPIQTPTDGHDLLSQSQSELITASTPIPTSEFLHAHKRTPTNTTSLSDTLSTSPPPSLFSHNNKLSPAAGELSASGSSSASDPLSSDTSAESSPNLSHKPAPGILDRVMRDEGDAVDPLDTPPPIPVKNLKLSVNAMMPKGKLGALSVKTKEGRSGAPEVIVSPGPVGGAFVMLTPGGSSDVEALSPRSGVRTSDEMDVMSEDGLVSSFDHDDDDEEDGLEDVKSQSAHTEGHVVGTKGKRGVPPKRGLTDPGSPAPGNKFASSVSASGHGSNVRMSGSGKAAGPPVAKSGWMSSVKRSVVGTLVRRSDKEKDKNARDVKDEEKRGRGTRGFNASHLPPSPTLPITIPENTTTAAATPVRSKTLSPSSPPPAPSSFWSRAAPPARTNARSQTLSPPTSPRGFSYYSNSNAPPVPASPRKAVSPVLYNAGDISKQASAIEDEETRRMTELAFMG